MEELHYRPPDLARPRYHPIVRKDPEIHKDDKSPSVWLHTDAAMETSRRVPKASCGSLAIPQYALRRIVLLCARSNMDQAGKRQAHVRARLGRLSSPPLTPRGGLSCTAFANAKSDNNNGYDNGNNDNIVNDKNTNYHNHDSNNHHNNIHINSNNNRISNDLIIITIIVSS